MKDILDKVEIIYEDENILAISKPVGLIVHSDGKTKDLTLVDWILEKYPEIKEVGEPMSINTGDVIWRPGIVHRLDKDTSGVLLIAKTQESFDDLKEQFKNRLTQKTYRAFVYGDVRYDQKTINTPIGRSKTDFRRWATTREIRGEAREAETEFKALIKNKKISYIEVYPKTGRTHQIRVHMKYDNHPLVADHLYAGRNFDRESPEKNLFFTTQALHAYKIEWNDLKGERMEIKAPLPKSFLKGEEILRKKEKN